MSKKGRQAPAYYSSEVKPRDVWGKILDKSLVVPPFNAVVRIREVPDPEVPGARIKLTQSLRDDPLGRLHARGQIDEAQYLAGRVWQQHYHHAEIGGLKAMDTTKEPVDGGRVPDVLTDVQAAALRVLAGAAKALGQEGDALVRDVLGHRLFIDHAAARRGFTSQRAIDYLARRFRECLETLAREFQLA